MAEVVDSIIAELILKSEGYAEGFDKATAAHGRFRSSVDALKGQTFDLAAEGQKYKAGLDTMAGGEESTTARIVKARATRTAAVKKGASDEVSAERAAADARLAISRDLAAEQERLATQQLTARRRARLQELQDARQAPAASGLQVIGGGGAGKSQAEYDAQLARTQVARDAVPKGLPINSVNLAGDAEVATEREVNSLLLEQASLRAGANAGDREATAVAREKLTYLNLYNAGLRANRSIMPDRLSSGAIRARFCRRA